MRTGAAAYFDFQAAGESLVAHSPDGKFAIQARQEPWGTLVTLNTAIATNVDGDRVSVYTREPAFLLVNGAAVGKTEISDMRLQHGGTLKRHGGTVAIGWRNGSHLTITRNGDSINYGFVPGGGIASPLRGLLANNGHGPNAFTGRDGIVLRITDSDFHSKLYKQFGNSWRIRQSESLFHYWPNESTAKFTNLSIPANPVAAASLSSANRSRAETICRAFAVHNQPALDDCILDVGLTGMPAFASAWAASGSPVVAANFVGGPPSAPTASPASTNPVAPRSSVDQFAIQIGDTISPGHPSESSGKITYPGEKQSYTFSAPAGTNIYVSVGPCEGATLNIEVLQADGGSVGGRIGCGDFGPIALPKAGMYRIVAAADGPSAQYTLTLRPAVVDQYAIQIGDTVSPGHPRAGAGIIEKLGQKQSYSFAGRAGETVFLSLGPCEGANPSFSILKPDNSMLDGDIGNCHVNFRETLPVTGTYRVVASTDKSDVSSRYGFILRPVPSDQHFSVRLPLQVSADVPSRTAGRIGSPGQQQFFDFSARSGATVNIQGKCGGSCPNLVIRATPRGDLTGYNYFDLNSANGDWKLPDGGKYTIEVRSNGYTGNYSFAASIK